MRISPTTMMQFVFYRSRPLKKTCADCSPASKVAHASSLRMVAAQMTLEEMHEQRRDYANQVRDLASEALAANGLELENVASSTSTRPASNISIRRTPSTPKV